jgi:hypothetical protein
MTEEKVACLCPACKSTFMSNLEALETAMADDLAEDELSSEHIMEDLEELRLIMKSFMKPTVLNALVDLLSELNKEPVNTEAYCWFVRNGQFGRECRYALLALKKFKETRLDRVKGLIAKCGEQLERL